MCDFYWKSKKSYFYALFCVWCEFFPHKLMFWGSKKSIFAVKSIYTYKCPKWCFSDKSGVFLGEEIAYFRILALFLQIAWTASWGGLWGEWVEIWAFLGFFGLFAMTLSEGVIKLRKMQSKNVCFFLIAENNFLLRRGLEFIKLKFYLRWCIAERGWWWLVTC